MRLKKRPKNMFFFLSMGRSGSNFLAYLLNTYTEAAVYHEHRLDRWACVRAYWSDEGAKRYLWYRSLVIWYRTLLRDINIYGEVNSYLRYHVDALKDVWNPVLFHLVRDGRDVVRSIMNRSAYTSKDAKHTGRIKPKKDDPFGRMWESMDRFEKVCWYWADTNRRLLNKKLPVVRLEDAIRSYEYFTQHILIPLDLELSEADWKKEKNKPKNINRSYLFPPWEDWSTWQKRSFERICGPIMTALGYQI